MSSSRERKKKHSKNKASSSNHQEDDGEAQSSTTVHDDLPSVLYKHSHCLLHSSLLYLCCNMIRLAISVDNGYYELNFICFRYLHLQVRVETLENGFLVNVFSEKNSPAMLVSVLEAFEQLGLDVLDARVSCEDTFQLEATGGPQVDVCVDTHTHHVLLPFSAYFSIYVRY